METKFTLTFEIGNDATLGDANVADIVRKVAGDIERLGLTDNRSYHVRDANGNSVGQYGRYVAEVAR